MVDPLLDPTPLSVFEEFLQIPRRVLLLGESGIGKSTFAQELARLLVAAGSPCSYIDADPGSPSLGVPGALCRFDWDAGEARLQDLEAFCSLDAGRFRLPLMSGLRRLLERSPAATLLIDAPGVVRGIAGAELLMAMAAELSPDLVLLLLREGAVSPLHNELQLLGARVHRIRAAAGSRRPGRPERARHRTRLWDRYMEQSEAYSVDLNRIRPVGAPPPAADTDAWTGRQVALLDRRGTTLALGEVVARKAGGSVIDIRSPRLPTAPHAVLVRDARRDAKGLLSTARPLRRSGVGYAVPPDALPPPEFLNSSEPRPVVRVGDLTCALVNGVFGDPLLHLRMHQQKRSLLMDLGDAGRLPARIVHQVSDVFISHAHIDHIGGFLWLLRTRIGESAVCRIIGPPGLAANVEGLLHGVLWDRIGDRGPCFEVAELHGNRLRRVRLRAGFAEDQRLSEHIVAGGCVLEGSGFRVRAITLDHGTPVLAFALETSRRLNIRNEALAAHGYPPGPWLDRVKRSIASDRPDRLIELPDGRSRPAGVLGSELVSVHPGQKLVYATDLADTPGNRERLIELAEGAHVLFCEAAFAERDASQATATGHLTSRACAEIAEAAGVRYLIPFHFSRRYEHEPMRIYDEVCAICTRAVLPANGTAADY